MPLPTPIERTLTGHTWRRLEARCLPARAERRITVHIGPHKTGSTSIQEMLRLNAWKLRPAVRVVPRSDPILGAFCAISRQHHTDAEVQDAAPALLREAARLARSCRHVDHALISHEDVLGGRPTVRGRMGLYPGAARRLGVLIDGIAAEGASVVVVFYVRTYAEWTQSLQRDLGRRATPLPSRRFVRRYGLAEGWEPVVAALCDAVGPERLALADFAADRDEGRMGSGLLRLVGVSERTLETVSWPPPRRVTREATHSPAAFGL
ncbi:MAG: hypothetical protein AAGA32_01005 [Pseudomonadota bacterium]